MLKTTKHISKKIISNRIFQHILFWVFSFIVLLNYFKLAAYIQKIDFIYTAIFHVCLFIATYVNHLWLIPNFLEKRRFILYFIWVSLLLLVCAEFNILLFDHWIDKILPGYYFISYYELKDMLLFVSIYVSLATLLKLSKGWFYLQQVIQDKTSVELQALRSQVNPHFLFNNLQSLYALALKQSPQTPDIILQLSGMLRYMLYEADEAQIELQKEVTFMDNYIALQSLRSSADKVNIQFIKEGKIENQKIAPLLFVSLLENSFKHGAKGSISGAYVHISLKTEKEKLFFKIENNAGQSEEETSKNEYKGLGLVNLKKRLTLLYPDKHQLKIESNDDTFRVELRIYFT